MDGPRLSPGTERRIELLFSPDERELVREILLHDCGSNLPSLKNLDEFKLERFRFAVLKLSRGEIGRLRDAVRLANRDWRDLLVAAGFASDIHAHELWMPEGRQ